MYLSKPQVLWFRKIGCDSWSEKKFKEKAQIAKVLKCIESESGKDWNKSALTITNECTVKWNKQEQV